MLRPFSDDVEGVDAMGNAGEPTEDELRTIVETFLDNCIEEPGIKVSEPRKPVDIARWRRTQALKHINDKNESDRSDEDAMILHIDASITRLAGKSPRAARVMELRYFGRLSEDSIARRIRRTEDTVSRDMRIGRAFLLLGLASK